MPKKLLLLAVVISLIGGACLPGGRNRDDSLGGSFPSEKLTLTIWRPIDSEAAFSDIEKDYRRDHPNVTFDYRTLEPETYEETVINALATGKGPDIISLPNDQVFRFKDKLVAMPESFFRGSSPVTTVTSQFAPAVVQDIIFDGNVYGYPLYTDSLTLFWNKDIFRAVRRELTRADIPFDEELLQGAPVDWDRVVEVTKLLTKRTGTTLTQSAIALGVSENVQETSDIVAALLLEQGAAMTTPDNRQAAFHLADKKNPTFFPGIAVLDFLKGFTDPSSDYYTWDSNQPTDLDAFISGQVAMILTYQTAIPVIEQRNPDLEFATAPLPQLANARTIVDYANYHVEAVTNNAKFPNVAWDYLQKIHQSGLSNYLSETDRTAAKRPAEATITTEERQFRSNPFRLQVPTAVSWFKGKDPESTDQILKAMLDRVTVEKQTPRDSLNQAAVELTRLLSGP